jgi:hypothetical protein
MNNKTLEQKLAQYHEFFSIEHNFSVNISRLSVDDISDFDHFLATMPIPFKLASDMTTIDQAALRPLNALSGVTAQLVEFLNLQAQKIDLLTGYILSQHDDENLRFQGIKMGGGGIKFLARQAFNVGDMIEMKVFLHEKNCAVYCFGEIVNIDEVTTNNINEYYNDVIFHFIREEDREVLVRASLHEQSKQLKKLAKQRNQEH